MELDDRITSIKGIGEKTAALFKKLGVETVGQLIRSYPRDYDCFEPAVPIASIEGPGIFAVAATVAERPRVRASARVKVVTARLRDESGSLGAVWFNMPYLAGSLKPGGVYIFRGRVIRDRAGLVFEHPAVLKRDEYESLLNARQPVYPLTAGLSNKTFAKAVAAALKELPIQKDFLPGWIRKKEGLAESNFAVRAIHFPKDEEELLFARKRLVFDEFFQFILSLRLLKGAGERKKNGFVTDRWEQAKKLEKALPYRLTGAQKETLSQIRKDMEGPSLMSRLIQGDVGSGKTIVAALALTAAVESGFQGALMAPTEVLARQHYKTLAGLFAEHGLSFRVELLTGSMTAKQKREACERIASHEADIIVGTHALIQEKVVYSCLGLVITDEQHRFGVRQRENLSKKGGDPHVLVMSATPIPRTLAIILYGDLDISVMDELPAKRLPVKNCVVGTEFRENAYRFMEKEIRAGHQAYVICPMVEAGGLSEGENVVDYAGRLRGVMPPSVRVDYLHGRMSPAQKDQKMEDFASGKTHILVSTTVVEVGVDVPNATVMMIENAERFGLAQLHQLRGRVGRGKDQSYCIFVNGSGDSEKNRRLEILNSSNDGFYIASEDLKLRGPGDIFGIRQSGLLEFSIGDIFTDAKLLKAAAEDAQKVLEEDPELSHEENRNLKRQIEKSLKERAESGMSL